jgi:SAM-dependent methyltransferase
MHALAGARNEEHGMARSEWFDDPELWEEQFDFMFPPESFEQAVTQVERLVEIAGIATGRVLDMPCGPGRHALPLARRGFAVTGVDLTAPLLDRAREAAVGQGLEIEWVRADMREFVRPESFEIALNAYTSLGYFREWDDNVRVLRNVHASLVPGGILVIELMGKEGLAAIFQPGSVHDLGQGRLRVERRRVVDGWRRVENDWRILDGDRVVGAWRLDHWIYSAGELIGMLEGVGFVDVETFAGWSREPYDHRARRLLAVARRP